MVNGKILESLLFTIHACAPKRFSAQARVLIHHSQFTPLIIQGHRKPKLTSREEAPAQPTERSSTMTWKEFVTDVENITLKFNKMAEMGLPIAELFSPAQAKPSEALAANVLPAIDQAIQQHQAGGATQQTATIALATVATKLANSGIVPPELATQINAAASVATGLPAASFTGASESMAANA
jgi:hypothetical protein